MNTGTVYVMLCTVILCLLYFMEWLRSNSLEEELRKYKETYGELPSKDDSDE